MGHTDSYTIKHEESFSIFDPFGDIDVAKNPEGGVYYKETRFLSKHTLSLSGKRLVLLSSAVKEDNTVFTADLTNPKVLRGSKTLLPQGCVHVWKSIFLYKNCCYEKIHLKNFYAEPVEFSISILFDADFASIFDVRGFRRRKKGEIKCNVENGKGIEFVYNGLDGLMRCTKIVFHPLPDEVSSKKAFYKIKLEPKGTYILYLNIVCSIEGEETTVYPYKKALHSVRRGYADWTEQSCKILTSNERFNQWVKRSWADIVMLTTSTEYGPYPYAGIPWFNTPFGRDGIITAFECLWINPDIAKGVLSFLAATQSRELDPERDAQPGKIVHEVRKSELTAIGELPFSKYYGTVDATPLFVVLASHYLDRTGDIDFVKKIWTNIRDAISWIDNYGDLDKDGLVEYLPSENGLINKGWKDSWNSVFYEDGRLAKPPVALVEVQGYVYQAKREGARLARLFGESELASRWDADADYIKELIERKFWCEDIGCFALALDGDKRPCKVRTSNAGHLLFSEAISPAKAKKIAPLFFESHFFSGWGIRTVSSLEKNYNPLSYHNGSVWPHDNAIIALGLSRYGFKDESLKIFKALFEASTFFRLRRIPELFCGFPRRYSEGPTHYPVACHPQAWSAGAVFLMLQASLGISFENGEVYFEHPMLPAFLDEIWIKDFILDGERVNLYFKKYKEGIVINVFRKRGVVYHIRV